MANLLSTTVNGALNSTGRITASYDTDRYQMNFNRASASNWWVTNDAGNLGFHLNNVGDRFYFGTGGDFWSSANGWLSTALAGKLSTGGTAANSSQLEGFSAYALVTEARGAHSGSDFPNGTLVTTDINANVWAGDSFIMEVSGKSYGSGTPFKLIMEGYLYADTIINVSAMSYGSYFPAPVKVMRYNGNIAFWWPRGSYWNSFEVHVRSANGDSWNRVTGITDSVDPASADKKISITPTQVIHTGNIGSQSVSYATSSGNSSTTSQRDFSGDISTSGMGRFAGWYTGNAQTGLAAEIGTSGGQVYIIAYNRQSGAYGTLNLESTGTNLRISGSTVNVTSGTLQQGGNAVIHAGNIGSQSVDFASRAEFQTIPDHRGNAYQPNDYAGNRVWWHFNNKDAVGGYGTYWHAIQTVSPWSSYDPSHRQQQIQWGGTDISFRYATSGTTWSSWFRFITDANISSQSVSYATSAGDSTNLGGRSSSRYLYYRGYSTSGDFQSLQSSESIIRFDQVGEAQSWSNAPGGYTYGGVLSMRGDNFGFQIWGSHIGDLYYKTQWNNDQYSGWRYIVHSGNIGSQSVSYATSAGTSTTSTHLSGRTDSEWYNVVWGAGNPSYMYSSDSVRIRSSDGALRANIYYDNNDTTYYLDPSSTTSIRTAGSWRSDSSAWDGEYAGKIQYHGNWWYFQSLNGWIFRRENGVEPFTFNQSGNLNIAGDSNTPINITGGAHKYLTINPGNGWEAMVRYIGGSGSSWYVGKRMASQVVGTESFHFYSEATSQTVAGISTTGDIIAIGSMQSPIYYDLNNTAYYGDFASLSRVNEIGANKMRADTNGDYATDRGWWSHDPYGQGWGKPHGSFRSLEVSTSGDFSNEPAMFRIHQWGSGAAEFWKPKGTILYLRETPGGSSTWFTKFEVQGSQNITGYLNVNGATEHTINDNDRLVGSNTNNRVFINGSIQLTSNNDAIVIGRGASTFLSDEELGFGWGGGWYMTDGTYLRVRNNKILYSTGEVRSGGYRGTTNVGGTGEASWHPAGIYVGSTQWLYGTQYRNGSTTSGQGWMYLDYNYGHSIVGLYDSTRYQGVWAMGDAYKLPVDGATTGSLYGLAWSHPNAGGVAGNLNTHGLLVMENGTFLAAISGSIRSRDDMRAPIFYDSQDTGYYLDPNGTSNLIQLTTSTRARWNMPRIWHDRSSRTSDQGYWTGTNGWGTEDGNWDGAWRGGFSGWDIWGAGTGHPQGGGYIHAQGIVSGQHLATSDGSSAYGWMMVGAHNATENRYWLRGKWGTSTSAWTEIMTSNQNTYAWNMDQWVRTTDSVAFNGVTAPAILVNNQSDNTKGYRIWNTSNTSVSAMFVNSANALVIAAGALDQVQLNKKTFINGAALGVNVAASATAGRIDASNDIVAYSSSDERLKENITPIENALDKVKSLTGVEFDWKPKYKNAHGYEGHDTGIIAQQVEAVMPSAVRTNDTGFLAVRYEKLIGLLIEANKELAARVEELEKKLN